MSPVRNGSAFWIRSVIPDLRALELQLQSVRNEGDELRIGGLSFGVADGIAKESLQSVQIPSVPGDFNGVADGPLHSGRGGAEVLGHLRVEHLGDGVGVLSARQRGARRGLFGRLFVEN